MKTLEELFKEFQGKTSLQRDEHAKKLAGTEVHIVGELSNIASDYLSCRDFVPSISSVNSIHIDHTGEQLRKQLLDYSYGDDVQMTARFVGVTFGEYDYYNFALVSIERLRTREVKEKAADERNLRQARFSGIGGILAGAVGGFVTGLVLNIALALVILPIYDWKKYGLGSPPSQTSWQPIVLAIATVGGAIMGYHDFFASARNKK